MKKAGEDPGRFWGDPQEELRKNEEFLVRAREDSEKISITP